MKTLTFLSFFCIVAVAAFGQTSIDREKEPPHKVGGYVGYQYNIHNASFSQLPGVASCCPQFRTGTGAGFAIGGLYELPLTTTLSLLLRGGYSSVGATLKETETIGNALQGEQVVSAEVEHYLETTLGIVSLQPAVSYAPFKIPVAFHLGVEGGFIAAKTYQQRELLVRPVNAVFKETRSGIRGESSGAIDGAASLRIAGFLGVSTEIPIGRNITLSPALEYFQGFTNVIADSGWTASTLRLATAVKFALVPAPKPLEPIVEPEPVTPKPVPTEPVLTAVLELRGIAANGTRQRVDSIVVEETEWEEHVPVLFHVFFGEGDASLASTSLRMVTPAQTALFKEGELAAEAMAVYSDALNILGSRMKNNPGIAVTLTGCNMDLGVEKNNMQLSRARAEAVKTYLTDVWGIATNRIAVKARNLPAKPANSSLADGQEENRRVEIAVSAAAMEPVRLKDISRVAKPSAIEVVPVITASAGVEKWTLDIRTDTRQLAELTNATQPAVWTVDPDAVDNNLSRIAFELTVRDRNGKQQQVSTSVPAKTLTLQQKRFEIKNDKRYEKFSLILFGYNEPELDEEHKAMLEKVKASITPASTVTILGYSDRTGDPAYNRQLAEKRCTNVRNYLGTTLSDAQVVVRAIGSDTLLFDNKTPQGRSYSRTVQVVVETPVK